MLIKNRSGFTLLELLISITIIGLISTIILIATIDSRNKGRDAGVKKNLVNARTQASLFFTLNNESYNNLCVDQKIRDFIQTATRSSGFVPKPTDYANTDIGDYDTEACHSNGARYAIWIPLNVSADNLAVGWCIDSTNTSTRKTVVGDDYLLGSVYQCP